MEIIRIIDEPVPFAGDEIQRGINYNSHNFVSWDPEDCPRCMNCDSKPWHKAAYYPCGVSVPRQERKVLADGSEIITILGCEA